jgi:signal transduction histidine kinase
MSDVRRGPAFLEWARGLDARWLAGGTWPRGWIASTALALALAIAIALGPPLRQAFALRVVPFTALLLGALGVALGVVELHRRIGLSPRTRGAAYCAAAFLHALAAGSVVTLSREPGSFALAWAPIAVAWWHVSMFKASLRAPFVPLSNALGLLAALALRPEPGPAAVLAVAAVVGPGFGLALGSFLVRARSELAFTDGQREAIAAQALAAAAVERERASSSLETALANERDARTALAALLGAVEALRVDARRGAPGASDGLREDLDALAGALARVAHSLDPGAADAASAVAVAAWPELRAAIDDARGRWPQIVFQLHAGAEPGPRVLVVGGREALRHVLDNLIANACEGDGTRRPSRVEVALVEGAGRLDVCIRDDGPGFPDAALASPVEPFASSKETGTGLGLFLVERVMRASGGALRRRNLVGGGAEATASLLRADRDDAHAAGATS